MSSVYTPFHSAKTKLDFVGKEFSVGNKKKKNKTKTGVQKRSCFKDQSPNSILKPDLGAHSTHTRSVLLMGAFRRRKELGNS